jgi:hypothetical protein
VKSRLCAVVSDVHFPSPHWPAWGAFVEWASHWRPAEIVVNGDLVDLEALSRYTKKASTPRDVIDEIKIAARELSKLADVAGIVTVVEGNHDDRWGRIVGEFAQHLDGAIGLTLEEQMRFQGLDPRVKWVREDVHNKGTKLGPFRVRHGHKQCGPFGAKHVAAGLLTRTIGTSQIVGHHHRAQLMCKTSEGTQIMAIANPHLSADHEYATDPDWQRGFTIVECFGDSATAYPVVMTLDGQFAWGGNVYGGQSASSVGTDYLREEGVLYEDFLDELESELLTRALDDVAAGDFEFDDEDTSQLPTSRLEYALMLGVDESTIRKWSAKTGRPWWQYQKTYKRGSNE